MFITALKMQEEASYKELANVASCDYSKSSKIGVPCCFPIGDTEDNDDECYKPAPSTSAEIFQEIDAELGLTENHFSRPEGYFGFSTCEELKMAIGNCEEMIKSSGDYTRTKHLVAKVVQLKMKLQEIEDAPDESTDRKIVLGHIFEVRCLERPRQYCEKCCGIIWGVLTEWYHCLNCGFKCHSKCLNLITRICANIKVVEKCSYELSICPEVGLSHQKFRCAECKKKFIFKNDLCLPRRCDYSGLHYCSHCHWNSVSIIPARVIHNWDFTPQKVCRASLQFLRLMLKKPVLNLESLNPTLFALVADLGHIKKLRSDILLMKRYLVTCHIAQEERLLLQLRERQHFVEGSETYSLQDLQDAGEGGRLVVYLEEVTAHFARHITRDCQGCRGKGFICELCKSEDVIFPFEPRIDVCQMCSAVFHQDCQLRWKAPCPKCARKGKASISSNDQTKKS